MLNFTIFSHFIHTLTKKKKTKQKSTTYLDRTKILKKDAEQIHILRCAKIVVTLHTTATLKKTLVGPYNQR